MPMHDPYRMDDDQAWNDGGGVIMGLMGVAVLLAALLYFGTLVYTGLGG